MFQRLTLLAGIPLSLAGGALAGQSDLAAADNLAAEARTAGRMGMPLVVVFSRKDCRYCESVKRDYLKPLDSLPAYRGRIVVREIGQDRQTPLVDFHGKGTTHARFAMQEQIRLVPVVAFYAPDGTPLAPPIVGARLPDFYQSDLDSAITQAQERLKQR